MNYSISVRPDKSRLINIIDDINKGRVKIPLFQREFVWQEKQILELFDSIEKGYPIGSLLYWKPEEDYQFSDRFGPYLIYEYSKETKYVLDGFQRLSTLFGTLTNPNKFDNHNSVLAKKFEIYFDLVEEEFVYNKKRSKPLHLLPLYVLIDTFDFLSFLDDLRKKSYSQNESNDLINRAKKLAKTFVDYEIPFIDIKGGDIKSAVDIFSRVNSTGMDLSKDWMLSALSYKKGEFLLSDRIDSLLKELEFYNYENLSRDTILNCIASSTDKPFFDIKVENLAHREDLPELVEKTAKNIKDAVQFLVHYLNVIEYKLLPYNNQLIFLTEFFRLSKNISDNTIQKLIKWFWVTSYSQYFTIYSLSKQRQAFNHFKDFSKGYETEPVFYYDIEQRFITNPFPLKVDFGSVRSKSLILFMLNTIYENSDFSNNLQCPTVDIRYINTYDRSTAGVIPLKSNDNQIEHLSSRKSDASFLFEVELSELHKYFIDTLMQIDYVHGYTDDILSRRFRLIQESEKEFVEKLNIKYTFSDGGLKF